MGERLNGIQEVDGSTPFSSTIGTVVAMSGPSAPRFWSRAWVMFALVVALSGVGGCAASHPRPSAAEQEDTLEAQPLPDDDSVADKAGELGVVGLMVTGIVGGILLPLFLL